MSLITQPLRDEHRELLTHVGHVRQLGDAAGRVPAAELQARLGAVVTFLERRVVPHMRAEEAVLYPAVERLIGAGATATMAHDRVEVSRRVDAMAALREATRDRELDETGLASLRELAYGLAAVLSLHFTKEDETHLPLLDRALSSDDAHTLLVAMERATAQATTEGPTG